MIDQEIRPPTTERYVLRPIEIDRDAEKLAEMWNRSDDQWPGTWSKGVPMTAARVRDWYERENFIDALIWDAGDAIAGYCSLWERPEEPGVTYIATLNVAPEFQKLSLARKFLTHYVERVVGLSSTRLDLHTWSGNLKAVPLYKKCGFFWMPGTSVHMLNFLPTILRMPATRAFFARHDWYRCFQRELTQAEDDERWEGMKVFTYRFAEDGEALTVWADREARRVTAIETDAFFAAAIAPDLEPARGLPAAMQWKLQNKRTEPMVVTLIARGTEHLKLDHRATLTLAPGEAVQLEAPVEISADAPAVRPGKPVPTISSLLILDGEVVELGTGLRPRAAVEVTTEPRYVTLLPGVPQSVRLQLRSRLKHAVTAKVGLAPAAGLHADWNEQTVALVPGGYAGISMTLTAAQSGVFALPVSISFAQDAGSANARTHLPINRLDVFALPLGGVLGSLSDTPLGKVVRIENETARVVLEAQGAGLKLYHQASGDEVLQHGGHAAPPAWPNEYGSSTFELRIEHTEDGIDAVASCTSREHPGFVFHKRISMTASAVMELEYELENLGEEARRFQVLQWFGYEDSTPTVTLPLAGGLTRGPAADFPGITEGEYNQPANFAERWVAVEYPHATAGVLWGDDIEQLKWSEVMTRLYDCPPHDRVRPRPLQIYIGDGGWRAVQGIWRRLSGEPPKLYTAQEPGPPLTARVEPAVAVAQDDAAQATLCVEHLRWRAFDGQVRLQLPEGWQADTTELELRSLNVLHRQHADLRFSTTVQPGAYAGWIEVRSPELDADFALPLVRLGDGRSVEVLETEQGGQRVLHIDNGRLRLMVTPGFGGTLSSLREVEVEHLVSAFPTVATLGWLSPWYGGVTPLLHLPNAWDFAGVLRQETFVAEPVTSPGEQGVVWQGVRSRADVQHEDLHGLVVEIDTLTVGGSPVVKQVLRLINQASVARHLGEAGFVAFVQPDGSRARTTVWGDDQSIKHSERIAWTKTGHWVAAENPETGRAITLISPLSRTGLSGWGAEGNHLELLRGHTVVPADGTIEVVSYLVVAEDVAAARRWAALKDL